ncbi:MAG: hypothetical protein ACFE9I_15800 [Candidatus Hermodarchaeota archaeon]
MEEDEKELSWTFKLDWLNILSMLNLESISQIPESKKEKAIKRISKFYNHEDLLEFEPSYLDKLVVNELKELMKRELLLNEKRQERIEKNIRNKIIPMKSGGIIRIDPNDLPKDFKDNPEELIKYFKKFLGQDDDDDDDSDNYKEDNTGYYI